MARPETAPEILREAAKWFDLVDQLLAIIEVKEGDDKAYALIERLGGPSTEIQDDLRAIADALEQFEIECQKLLDDLEARE